jgi:hypothetical protein
MRDVADEWRLMARGERIEEVIVGDVAASAGISQEADR